MWIIELQCNCASISTLWSKLCSTWRVRGHEYRAMFVNYQWGWKFLKFCEGSLSLLRYAYHILEYIECSFKTNLILVHFWQIFKWKVLTYIFFKATDMFSNQAPYYTASNGYFRWDSTSGYGSSPTSGLVQKISTFHSEDV